jgi:hypothetical protein
MQERTETAEHTRVVRLVDLERRVNTMERTLSALAHSTSMLVDEELRRMTADFTPEELSELRESTRQAAAEIIADVRARAGTLTLAQAAARTNQQAGEIEAALRTGDLRSLAPRDLDAWRRSQTAKAIVE